jgi:hypothetical protein
VTRHDERSAVAGGWVSVTDLLCIGPAPRAVIATTDINQAFRLIRDGLCVAVPSDQAAVAVLMLLGVEQADAERRVRWAHGDLKENEVSSLTRSVP